MGVCRLRAAAEYSEVWVSLSEVEFRAGVKTED